MAFRVNRLARVSSLLWRTDTRQLKRFTNCVVAHPFVPLPFTGSQRSMVATVARRRSARLEALNSSSSSDNEKPKPAKANKKPAKARAKVSTQKNEKDSRVPGSNRSVEMVAADTKAVPPATDATSNVKPKSKEAVMLPRSREMALKKKYPELNWIMGIDEAGRGPLAGPVVAAAAIVPDNIKGITDSKKITCESAREELYEQIVNSPGVIWAVAVVDAGRIDEINILQATMQAMSMAASALVMDGPEASNRWDQAAMQPVCVSRKGSYVTCGGTKPVQKTTANTDSSEEHCNSAATAPYYALIDGNRVPKDLVCECEPIVKGDSKEYAIAAASILAKVSRDRLMHGYDKLYPAYNLAQHKGYPTKNHMAAVHKFGASPIHRRSFAPLKHMQFNEKGEVIHDSDSQ
ncbi:Ribonuclease HII [Seminavis robusta]|uniref:Ribonuclease n=1 Tax=Seminavis robusta TaxID=568900 RepID=A0A9N8DER0_9STRA|nr:Ribonuclease HII [Seminavis robusta]|eukprot:Sro88_g046510.1 Ribonuclease HII (406) ;mRNA; f:66030-67247